MCGSRKYPYPITEGIENSKGVGGGQRLRKFQREGGWTIKITFQGVNFELSKKTAAYWLDHFGRHK